MSAKTRPQDEWQLKRTLANLATLFATAIDLLQKGARSPTMIDALLRALQLFKENTLGVALPTPETRNDEPARHIAPLPNETSARDQDSKNWQAVFGWAWKRVRVCAAQPNRYRHQPQTILAAKWVLEYGLPSHQCYWNDRFAIAILCDLDWQTQRLATWCLVSNGLQDYWEWQTHCGFDIGAILKKLDVLESEFQPPKATTYTPVGHPHVLRRLVEKYNLPTCHFDPSRSLADRESAERNQFNGAYPYASVL